VPSLEQQNADYIRSVAESDVDWFRANLSDDFLCTLGDGGTIGKEAFLGLGTIVDGCEQIGTAIREMHKIDGGYLQQHDVDFSASFILAGQLKTGQLRLFLIYDAGNFIEAMGDTIYFQIGEVKYGKPILDRIIQPSTSLNDAVKCALISFDSTMRSNVSVGPPIDIFVYRRDSMAPGFTIRLEGSDPYLRSIRDAWGSALHKAFQDTVPGPGWKI